jgi:7-keto-8-aminopelargonate synthetase-like enzyme
MFLDSLVHASILDGLAIATSPIYGGSMNFSMYRHKDVADLEYQLKSSKAENKLIVTDGVFSLHGHLAPMDKIIRLARKYDAEVYVDDAHGTGIFGPNGRGTAEHFGVYGDVDFPMGTLSKALGGAGGYFAGSADMCDYLRVACRTHVFQTSMPPVVAAGLIASFDLIRDEPQRRHRLLAISARVNSELLRLGFDTLGTETQIIPVRFGDPIKALKAQQVLFNEGIFAPRYYYPAVPKGEDMVRINLMSAHSDLQIDLMLSAMEKAGKATGVI